MALSLKDVAARCLSLSPPFSVVTDVFGYSATRRPMSLKRQLQLVQGPSLGVNVILVGVENFTAADIAETEEALQRTREIYGVVDLGIRKLEWFEISTAAAGGYTVIESESEALNLTNDFSAPSNGFLDLFVVQVATTFDGRSATDGSCDKDDGKDMTGSVASLNGPPDNSGNTFAHEIGHYLGLDHVSAPDNFIGNNGSSNSNTGIAGWQGDKMKEHCFVSDVC
jgi:hypothetical protein